MLSNLSGIDLIIFQLSIEIYLSFPYNGWHIWEVGTLSSFPVIYFTLTEIVDSLFSKKMLGVQGIQAFSFDHVKKMTKITIRNIIINTCYKCIILKSEILEEKSVG